MPTLPDGTASSTGCSLLPSSRPSAARTPRRSGTGDPPAPGPRDSASAARVVYPDPKCAAGSPSGRRPSMAGRARGSPGPPRRRRGGPDTTPDRPDVDATANQGRMARARRTVRRGPARRHSASAAARAGVCLSSPGTPAHPRRCCLNTSAGHWRGEGGGTGDRRLQRAPVDLVRREVRRRLACRSRVLDGCCCGEVNFVSGFRRRGAGVRLRDRARRAAGVVFLLAGGQLRCDTVLG